MSYKNDFKRKKIIKKNKLKTIRNLNFNTICLILIPIFFIGGTLAKYINNKTTDLIYEAKKFYFESDLLTDNTNLAAYTYSVGSDTIKIEIKNNIDELRYSEVETKYEIKITDIHGNSIKDKDGNVVSTINGTLSKNQMDKDIVEFTNLPTGNYVVIAQALSPYTKTIQASFVLTEKQEELSYTVNDSQESPILQITVLSEDYSGNVKITWPSGIAPDSTSSEFKDIDTGYNAGSTVISFEANSENNFKFFKKNPSLVYDNNDFSVERSE